MSSLVKKALFLLASALDETVDWERTLTSPYLRLKFPSYKDDYFQETIKKMLKTGDIEKVVKKGEPLFKITSQGRLKLIREVPLAKRIGEKWDERWRMVIFDIPEISKNKREGLRRKLKELGFAGWQKSVYITPFDVAQDLAQYLASVNLAEYAIALEAKKIFVGDERQMANKLWHIDKLNARYREFFEKFQGEKDKDGLQEEYLFILETDPCLPKDLLPEPWWGSKARKLAGGA